MRCSSFGFRGKNPLRVAAAVAAFLLVGCTEDPGLQERLNRLQAEMQEKDRQLQDARSALEKTKGELKSARAANASKPTPADSPAVTTGAKGPFLSREQVEESYDSASKTMQKHLAAELRDYSVENCAQFPVTMPSDEYPYHSKVVLTFRSDSGRAYHLEYPVSADASGKWTFPGTVDIAGALTDSRVRDDNNAATASHPGPATGSSPKTAPASNTSASDNRPRAPGNVSLVPGQTATETRVIDWGGSRPTPAASTTGNVVPTQSPTPQQSKAPSQTMPADRDVRVHW